MEGVNMSGILPDYEPVVECKERENNLTLDCEDPSIIVKLIKQEMQKTDMEGFEDMLERIKSNAKVRKTADNYTFAGDIDTEQGKYLNIKSERIKEIVEETGKGYEVITGECVPYYDFEILTDKVNGRKLRDEKIKELYEAIYKQIGGNIKIYAFDASGIIKDKYKISFHVLLRNAGYYSCGKYTPKIEGLDGIDNSVYKEEGKQQKFRVPYASKDGKTRKLRRITWHQINGVIIYDTIEEAEEILGEKYEDYLIQNTGGEIGRCSEEEYKLILEESKIKPPKKGDILKREKLEALINCIDNTRDAIDWDTWIRIVWATMNTCIKYGIQGGELIVHEWSKLNSKYCKQTTNAAISSMRGQNDTRNKLGMKYLNDRAKASDPIKYDKWLKSYASETINPQDPYCWIHFKKEKCSKKYTDFEQLCEDIRKDLPRVMAKVLEGDGYYVKKDGDYRTDKVFNTVNTINRTIDFTLHYSEWKMVKEEWQTTPKETKFSKVVDSLIREYGYMDCDPGNTDSICLNSFMQFKTKEAETTNEAIIKPITDFLHDIICNKNTALYEWLIKWLCILVKHPEIKPEVVLVLITPKEGTGKGTFVNLLTNLLGIYHCVAVSSVSEATAKFNMNLYGKRLGFLNEVVSSRDEFMAAFQKMKSWITDYRMPFEIKGGAKFTGFSGHAWVFTSNNRDCIVMPKGTRRYCCFEVSQEREQDREYFKKLGAEINKPDVMESFMSFLMKQQVDMADLVGKDKIPETELRKDMIALSRPNHEKFLLWLKEQWEYEQTEEFKNDDDDSGYRLTDEIQATQLHELYKEWCDRNRVDRRRQLDLVAFGIKISNSSEQLIQKKIGRARRAYYILSTIKI